MTSDFSQLFFHLLEPLDDISDDGSEITVKGVMQVREVSRKCDLITVEREVFETIPVVTYLFLLQPHTGTDDCLHRDAHLRVHGEVSVPFLLCHGKPGLLDFFLSSKKVLRTLYSSLETM